MTKEELLEHLKIWPNKAKVEVELGYHIVTQGPIRVTITDTSVDIEQGHCLLIAGKVVEEV